ncbi:hypothetical protein SK128_002337 [Halocaridina rubra]|uniref:Uncharacterized protein n=1 Tax=Halocaridina rubra TaxID=373956 RepID=A0AAN8XD40_HALRR
MTKSVSEEEEKEQPEETHEEVEEPSLTLERPAAMYEHVKAVQQLSQEHDDNMVCSVIFCNLIDDAMTPYKTIFAQKKLVQRLECWLEISENHNKSHPLSPTTPTTFREIHNSGDVDLPEFPLIPASKGFCITLWKTLKHFKAVLGAVGVSVDNNTPSMSCKEEAKLPPKTPVGTPNSESKASKSPYVEMDGENVVGSTS